MKKNFKFICLTAILFLAFSSVSFGQVYKLKTTSFASMYKINDYKWSDWGEWEETSLLITIDLNKERITMYSKETQVYDIVKDEGEEFDKDGDKTLSLYCVNEEGLTCRVRLVRLNSQSGKTQIYVDFNDFKFVYNYYSLD